MKTSRCGTFTLAAFTLTLAACGGGGSSDRSPSSAAPPTATANTAPKISNLSSGEAVAQDASTEPVVFNVTDVESAASSLKVTAESSNPGLISADGIQLIGNDASRAVLLTPMEGIAGTSTITITATDAEGLSTQQAFNVTVTSESRSFKELVATAYAKESDAAAEETAGLSLMDNPEDDETAFDALFAD